MLDAGCSKIEYLSPTKANSVDASLLLLRKNGIEDAAWTHSVPVDYARGETGSAPKRALVYQSRGQFVQYVLNIPNLTPASNKEEQFFSRKSSPRISRGQGVKIANLYSNLLFLMPDPARDGI